MSLFSILWKNLKKCVFIEEFDEKYENSTTATIFGLYCFSGGFCFHEDVRPEFRKFWIYYNVINFIVVNVSCMFFLFNATVDDFSGWLLTVHLMLGLLGKALIYYWTYSIRDLITKLIDTVDENERKYEKYVPFCTMNVKISEMITVKILCCMLVLCTLAFNLENYVRYENYLVNFYPMYFPFRTTSLLRTIIRFIQGATCVPEIILFEAFPMLIFTITLDIYNRFDFLSVFLRETTYSVRLQIDEIWNMEVAMDEQRLPKTLTKINELKMRKALALDELVRKTIIVIERHQELYSFAKLLAKKFEYIGCATFSAIFLLAVVHVFFISSIIDPKHLYRSLIFILVTCGLFLLWFAFCFTGELFQKMNDLIATEIYESPWYLLKPKDRRLVHTFLTIVQRPISIVVWRIYPVNLGSFPGMLNMVYSNMQRLRTLQSRNRK